jgi:SAM-dependent methyltransferase
LKPTRSLDVLSEERIVPSGDGDDLFAWHLARYRFAAPFAAGGRVLDIGSGEGYGPALLASTAREVVGVDYSPAAIEHARATHARDNLRFKVMDATALDPALGQFDLVTCFEVVEHVVDDDALLAGICARLRPGGVLVLSTPNRTVETLFESIGRRDGNEYHVNLLSPKELRQRAKRHFGEVVLYGQSMRTGRVHTALKALDVLNLRHRVVRSRSAQQAITGLLTGARETDRRPSFRFSRMLVRQSPAMLLVARA